MSDLRFEFQDAFDFAEAMAAAPQVVESELVTATDRVAIYGMGVSIRNTPVDQGHLRRSNAQMPTSYNAGVATGGWGNATPYAEAIEKGRRGFSARPGKILAFTPKGSSQMIFRKSVGPAAAQPFMEPGRAAAESRMDAEFSGAIQRIVKALGG